MKLLGPMCLLIGLVFLLPTLSPLILNVWNFGPPVGIRIFWRSVEIDFSLPDDESRIVEILLWPTGIAASFILLSIVLMRIFGT